MSTNGKAHVAPQARFHPWPWGLVAAFTVFFAVQFWMIAFVSRGFEGPDDMQYYRHGLEYGKVVQDYPKASSAPDAVLACRPEAVSVAVPVLSCMDSRGGAGGMTGFSTFDLPSESHPASSRNRMERRPRCIAVISA